MDSTIMQSGRIDRAAYQRPGEELATNALPLTT